MSGDGDDSYCQWDEGGVLACKFFYCSSKMSWIFVALKDYGLSETDFCFVFLPNISALSAHMKRSKI